jgi:hypothetical protein
MKERLEYIRTLSRANGEQTKIIQSLHIEIFNKDIQISCPTCVRIAVNRLKNYYNEKYT